MINKERLIELYYKQKIRFPLIGAVIQGNTEGIVLCNDESNPTHIFVINKFGFCQELYSEWDANFFENEIKKYIYCSSRMKLRLYNPTGKLLAFVKQLPFSSEAKRMHFNIDVDEIDRNRKIGESYIEISPMTEESFMDIFSLDLDSRYYKDKKDYCEHAIPYVAKIGDEEVGIIYGAGNDGERYEIDYYVSEKYRNLGIGSKLILTFVNKCFKIAKTADMDIYCNNFASIRVAEKCGFKPVLEYSYFNIEKC